MYQLEPKNLELVVLFLGETNQPVQMYHTSKNVLPFASIIVLYDIDSEKDAAMKNCG